MNVYFVSGFLANCNVFDRLKLPEGFDKKYLEWYIPKGDETLEQYAQKMAEEIDQSSPFVLIGYSFGGMVVQEMNRFLNPLKTIIIASIKDEREKPRLHRIGKRINFVERFPLDISSNINMFNRIYVKYLYHIPPDESSEFINNTDAVYMKWSISQILNWKPSSDLKNLCHIHGTKDQAFPFSLLHHVDYVVEKGDHLMVFKKHREVSRILSDILLLLPNT